MEERRITCVVCPKGCGMRVHIKDGVILSIEGSGCARGDEYAAAECIHPVRVLTTIVRVEGGRHPMAPVKSGKPIPKDLLAAAVKEINHHTVKAPVRIGDVIVSDILGTGVNIIATGNVDKANESRWDVQ